MRKKRYSRFVKGLSGACLAAVLALSPAGGISSLAAEADAPYDYQITFYAGNQGSFAAGPSIQVLDASGARKEASVEAGADTVRVRGLAAGDRVVFDQVQGNAVDLGTDSPYYVRGIRRSGRDNDDEKPASFLVEQDQDYVVAYGVKGEMVSYVIRYEDRSGRTLAESRTYYGNAGDRPVVAFRYIEGYEPQAYNLTKTLSKNEAENVFTFVYSRVQTSSGSSSGGGTTGGGTAGTVTNTGAEAGGTGAAGAGAAGGAGFGTAGGAVGAGAAGTAGDAAGTETPAEGAEEGVEAPDGEVPADEGPRDLVDLDDEETPLSNFPVDEETAKAGVLYSLPVFASISLILALVLAVCAGLKYRAVRKKRENEEDH